MINLIPPMFATGGRFDVAMIIENECGKMELIHGVYFDNMWYSLTSLLFSYLGIVVPVLRPQLPKPIKMLSIIVGSWWLSGFAFEIMNWFVPTEVLNTMFSRDGFNRYLIVFILSVSIIFLHKQWTQLKKN